MNTPEPSLPDRVHSPAALLSLENALANVFWFKSDLRSFLCHTLTDRSIVPLLDWKGTKRAVVATLVRLLARDPGRFGGELDTLMNAVAAVDDFRHLARLDDGDERVMAASHSVETLRGFLKCPARAKPEEDPADGQELQSPTPDTPGPPLTRLRVEFVHLLSGRTTPALGGRWHRLIQDVLVTSGLDVGSSRLVDGIIEGEFTLDDTPVALHVRWQPEPVELGDVLALAERLWREPRKTPGLFLSVNGFAPGTLRSRWDAGCPLFLMDGRDLMAVLEERIDLAQLLVRKRRHAARSGEIMLPVGRVLGST